MAFRTNYGRNQGFTLGPLGFLIIANVIVFIVTTIRPDLINLLGLSGQTLLSQPWTMITSMFTHYDIWHILGNMVTLYFYGSYLINLVGEKYFFIIYFIGGLVGNVVFLLLSSPFALVIGASGAIFALGGALAILRPNVKVLILPIPVPMPLWVAVIGGFLLISFVPGVAWQAHLGGLALGLGAAYYLKRRTRTYF